MCGDTLLSCLAFSFFIFLNHRSVLESLTFYNIFHFYSRYNNPYSVKSKSNQSKACQYKSEPLTRLLIISHSTHQRSRDDENR